MKTPMAITALLFLLGCSCEHKSQAKKAPGKDETVQDQVRQEPAAHPSRARENKAAATKGKTDGDIRDKIIPGYEKMRKDGK